MFFNTQSFFATQFNTQTNYFSHFNTLTFKSVPILKLKLS